jgi:hypothetical protein
MLFSFSFMTYEYRFDHSSIFYYQKWAMLFIFSMHCDRESIYSHLQLTILLPKIVSILTMISIEFSLSNLDYKLSENGYAYIS